MRLAAALIATALVTAPAVAEPQIGQAAPNFRLNDADGRVVTLSDYRGKTVVLEWNNPGCPFVQKHYGSGNMQRSQAAATRDGIVWLTVNSGAPGKQGYMTGPEAKAFVARTRASPSDYLLDPKGVVGKAYDAKTTPHMYIVDARGSLVYAGGIDDRPTADPADIAGAHNYVLAALSEMKAGKAISTPTSRPYGCSVKYPES